MSVRVQHRTVALQQVVMHYAAAAGGGETVVLLHGWPQTWYAWRKVLPHLARAGYDVIAPDLRSLGDTSRPVGGHDSGSVAGDVSELLGRHLGVSRFHLVGHDWGGAAAFAVAAAVPATVQSLTVVDVTVPGLGPDLSQGGRRWHHAFHMTPDLPEALTQGRERTYLAWFYRAFAHQADAIDAEAVDEYLRCYGRPGALGASLAYYRSLPDTVAANQALAASGFRLAMPVLAVGGGTTAARGRAREPAESLRTIADAVTESVIADCGHFVPEEQPEAFSRVLLGFLAGLPDAGRRRR